MGAGGACVLPRRYRPTPAHQQLSAISTRINSSTTLGCFLGAPQDQSFIERQEEFSARPFPGSPLVDQLQQRPRGRMGM